MDILKQRRLQLLAPQSFDTKVRFPQLCNFPGYVTGCLSKRFIPELLPLKDVYDLRCRNAFIEQWRDADLSRRIFPSISKSVERATDRRQNEGTEGIIENSAIRSIHADLNRISGSFEHLEHCLDKEQNDMLRVFENNSLTDHYKQSINYDILQIKQKVEELTVHADFRSDDSGIDDNGSESGSPWRHTEQERGHSSSNPSRRMSINSEHKCKHYFMREGFPYNFGRVSPGERSFDSGISHEEIKSDFKDSLDDFGWHNENYSDRKATLIRQAFSNWNSNSKGSDVFNQKERFLLPELARHSDRSRKDDRVIQFEKYLIENKKSDSSQSKQNPKKPEKRKLLPSLNSLEVFFSGHSVTSWRDKIQEFLSKSSTNHKNTKAEADQKFLQKLEENKEFSDEMVQSHNALRQCHGCSELSPAEDLSKDAQMWADIIAEKGFLQYSELSGRGENIIFLDTNGLDPTGTEVTKMWYGQQKFHDFKNPRWRKDTMNFSQVIWKSTSEIGIGVAKIKGRDKMVVVAQYRPAGNGNMPGEFRKNVPPPR